MKIIVDRLNDNFIGQKLIKTNIISGRFYKKAPHNQELINSLIQQHGYLVCGGFLSKGKFIYAYFNTPEYDQPIIMMHSLAMTGYWSDNKDLTHNRYSMDFQLSDDSIKSGYYNDVRNFRTIKYITDLSEFNNKIAFLGIDLLNEIYQPENNLELLKRFRWFSNQPICVALMNQQVLAGVGNYIKCEALYQAMINPFTLVKNLDDDLLLDLTQICANIMHEAYQVQGAAFKNFKDNNDYKAGKAQEFFQVYSKSMDPLGNQVITTPTPDGRTTHWIPSIQTL